MKSKSLLWYIVFLPGLFLLPFTSCTKEKEKPAPPTIEVVHLGSHDASDENVFYLGEEGHFEVNIHAPGLIQKIELEIRQESGYAIFDLKKEYTGDYVGQKEVAGFVDYPVIPEGQAIGVYSFHLKVTDQLGQVANLDENINVEAGDGTNTEHQHDGH
ncbi:MAG: DUF4625 domain-containing protein [Sphingobacteriales bacterium]|nr:DUF4625 domain-containing protein [Sphingobacteriales bacterium]OJY91141.1 MAG: hypothetical protein BGP14_07105 [Sphingobacteriales bacterium 44-15]